MVDGWVLWLLVVGLAVGAVVTWLLLVRVPRHDGDVGPDERRDEAAWISRTIEHGGGIAPPSLVEEVLDLHDAYLRDPNAAPELSVPAPPVMPVESTGRGPTPAASPPSTATAPAAASAPAPGNTDPPATAR